MIELYKHNKESYEKIKSMFETKNKVAVVQPTGTGKSFLMLKWIEDNRNNNIVVLSSSNAILTQLYNYAEKFNCLDIFKNVEVFTYTKFLYMTSKEIKRLKADKIIIDEFHRTGAGSWYKKVNMLLESHEDADVLGLSATPIRYLDNARNMVEEILDGNVANEITLGEAVYKGILPKFEYITASYTHDDTKYILERIKCIKDKTKRSKLLKQYKEMIHNIEQGNKVEDLFRDNIKSKSGKFIVFCKSIAHTNECKKRLIEWFNKAGMDTNIYISTSNDYDKDTQLEKFINDKSDKIKLLLSVNRFNEGLHVEDITGIIMMRPTLSPIMYLQQLGRALSSSHKGDNPIVFDLVNNYSYIIPYMNRVSNGGSGNPFTDQYIEAMIKDRSYEPNIHIDFDIFQNAIKYNELISEIEDKLYYDNDKIWNNKYELLKEFINEFNRFPKNNEEYKEINLGNWLHKQKYYYQKEILPKERKEKLLYLNSNIFDNFDNDKIWNDRYELLKEFINEFNRFPKKDQIYKNIKLGSWFSTQKILYKKNYLTIDRIQKLNLLNIKIRLSWNDKYELLKEFINKNNRLPKSAETYENEQIGYWIGTQKGLYRQGKLSEEKVQKLKCLGIKFNSRLSWNDKYELLKEFINKNNRLPIKNTIYKDIKLGDWLHTQKDLYRQGKLSEEKVKKLKCLNINILINNNTVWNDKYELLKEFINKNNRLPKSVETYKDIRLGSWLNNQKHFYKKGKLSEEKVQKLESLGVKFD